MPAAHAAVAARPAPSTFRQVTQETAAFITREEGLRLVPYDDATGKPPTGSKVRGTLTVGVGHTGPDVVIGKAITEEEAKRLLDKDLDEAEEAVSRLVKVPLTDHQFGALVTFVFNIGVGAFASSTLLRRLNEGNYGAVPEQLARWDKTTIDGKKVQLAALAARRAREAAYWATPDKPPVTTGDAVAAAPRDVNVIPFPIPTQRLDTPAGGAPLPSADPAPVSPPVADPVPDKRPWNSITVIGLALTAAGTAFDYLKEQLEPLQNMAPWIGTAFVVVTVGGIVVGLAGRLRLMSTEGR